MRFYLDKAYDALMLLACLSMLGAFASIMLGVIAREAHWDIQGLDAYAGYAIASSLFLALPATLKSGDHIRVTLILGKAGPRLANALEYWGLAAGLALCGYLAFFACRLVWVSYTTHDISQGADASALWIPQLTMALGCVGLAIAFADALVCRVQGTPFFSQTRSANVE